MCVCGSKIGHRAISSKSSRAVGSCGHGESSVREFGGLRRPGRILNTVEAPGRVLNRPSPEARDGTTRRDRGRGMNVVVTGGGTIAPIDDVRRLTNVSTGRFAAAITEACLERGAAGLARPRRRRPSSRCVGCAAFDLDARRPGRRAGPPRATSAVDGGVPGIGCTWSRSARGPSPNTPRHSAERLHPRIRSTSPSWRWRSPTSSPSQRRQDQTPTPTTLVIRCRRTPKVIRSVRDWAPSVYLVGFKLLSDAPACRADPTAPRRPAAPTAPT